MESCERIEDACWEGVFRDKSVVNVDDCDVRYCDNVLADVGFGIEVTKTPAWFLSVSFQQPRRTQTYHLHGNLCIQAMVQVSLVRISAQQFLPLHDLAQMNRMSSQPRELELFRMNREQSILISGIVNRLVCSVCGLHACCRHRQRLDREKRGQRGGSDSVLRVVVPC